jgi:CRISPR system Cascade subunit CasA
MPEKEFNLLHEPWLLVMRPDGEIETVSLLELFERAQEFRGLAGELPTQDVAVLRLLLAILHAVFARWDPEGRESPLSSPTEARRRWKALWEQKAFPYTVIKHYLLSYEERFWLFHPQYPFYQVPELKIATEYTAAKLNGELSQSSNKLRLFPQCTGESQERLSYAEATRWLLYVNAFDDTSAKPTRDKERVDKLPSPGAGWLGKLGLITAIGDNLFETLMLNLVLLRDGGSELWGEETPIWEVENVKTAERTPIPIPDNLSALYTLQSRRLLLKRDEDSIIGYMLLGGDFLMKENAFTEQMTVSRNVAKKKTDRPEYSPQRHDPTRQLWSDFSALIAQTEGKHRPGVVSWLASLSGRDYIPCAHFRFQTAAVKYGDKDFFVDDVFSDSVSFDARLLTDLGAAWVSVIAGEIGITDKLVSKVGQLAQNLAKAAGSYDGSGAWNAAREQAYFRLDIPFRQWLESIDPENSDMDDARNAWWKLSQSIVRDLGKELVEQAGPRAFVGRMVKEKSGEYRYTAPELYNRFIYYTSNHQALEGGMNHG